MEINNLHLVYFSPTGTTKSVLRAMAKTFNVNTVEHDVTDYCCKDIELQFEKDDFVILGFPVYSGRVPRTFAERFGGIRGRGTPAVLAATYGNREYADALLEMKNLAGANGFLTVGAAAIVAEHSVILSVAAGRPDVKDMAFVNEFCAKLQGKIAAIAPGTDAEEICVPGKEPYVRYEALPMAPVVSASCTACGHCVKKCPVGAISAQDPRKTDKNKCIGCMRCVRICPPKARYLSKIKMAAGAVYLAKAKRIRKEPEMLL